MPLEVAGDKTHSSVWQFNKKWGKIIFLQKFTKAYKICSHNQPY